MYICMWICVKKKWKTNVNIFNSSNWRSLRLNIVSASFDFFFTFWLFFVINMRSIVSVDFWLSFLSLQMWIDHRHHHSDRLSFASPTTHRLSTYAAKKHDVFCESLWMHPLAVAFQLVPRLRLFLLFFVIIVSVRHRLPRRYQCKNCRLFAFVLINEPKSQARKEGRERERKSREGAK